MPSDLAATTVALGLVVAWLIVCMMPETVRAVMAAAMGALGL